MAGAKRLPPRDRYEFEPRKVEKPWGWELIWAEAEAYVGKLLFVRAGQALSAPVPRGEGRGLARPGRPGRRSSSAWSAAT